MKWVVAVIISIIVLLIGSQYTYMKLEGYKSEKAVLSYLLNEEQIDEEDIIATRVFHPKGSPIVAVYYAHDKKHLHYYFKSRMDETDIIFDGKQEIDTIRDYWILPYLDEEGGDN